MNSAIYRGRVRHRRFQPKGHEFEYPVFMMYLDLDELDQVFSLSRLWSLTQRAPAQFKRTDYFAPEEKDLKQAVVKKVRQQTGLKIDGAVRLLTNLRYFGFVFNPISIYYCFDRDENLQAMMLEVTNTPWRERHQYVLACDPKTKKQRITFDKAMHVSPFNPMAFEYHWFSQLPEEKLQVHMQNIHAETGENIFDASLTLSREAISTRSLNRILLRYPFMTGQVVFNIYWQALKLFFHKVPLYRHPGRQEKESL
jgi:uncharacterized protein